MNQPLQRTSIRVCALLTAALFLSASFGCGNEDYQRPIQQFQSASTVVNGAARDFWQQLNVVEEKTELDRQMFEAQAFDEAKIKAKDIITVDELNARVNALDQLARYTSALADLAALKSPAEVTQKFQNVGSSFTKVASDAAKVASISSPILSNAKFSGAVQAAATGIGAVVRAIEEHRARREIEKEIRDQDESIKFLISLIGDELAAAYERRKKSEGAELIFLTNSLKFELEKPGHGDPVLRMLMGERLRDWRNRQPVLLNADPKPAVEAMRKAHESLVNYVTADKSPKSLSDLIAAAESFFERVQPFGQAVAALVSKS